MYITTKGTKDLHEGHKGYINNVLALSSLRLLCVLCGYLLYFVRYSFQRFKICTEVFQFTPFCNKSTDSL